MEIQLLGGIRIKLKGFVDRVDRIGHNEYRIIYYKTGSTSKYKPSEYFSGGTQLQHALYSIAVEQWLRETGIDPEPGSWKRTIIFRQNVDGVSM